MGNSFTVMFMIEIGGILLELTSPFRSNKGVQPPVAFRNDDAAATVGGVCSTAAFSVILLDGIEGKSDQTP